MGQWGVIIVARDQMDALHRRVFGYCFAEADEILDLAGQTNVGIFDDDLFCPFELWVNDRLVTVACVAMTDS